MPMGGLRRAASDALRASPEDVLRQARRIEVTRSVAEVLHRHAHAIHQRQMEVRHRRFLAVDHAAARLEVIRRRGR